MTHLNTPEYEMSAMLSQWSLHYSDKAKPSAQGRHLKKRSTIPDPPRASEALIEACAWGRLDLVGSLLELGADPASADFIQVDWDEIFARGNPSLTAKLLERNCKMSSRVKLTPLMAAALFGQIAAVETLAGLVDVNQRIEAEEISWGEPSFPRGTVARAISFAAAAGHQDCIDKLLDSGAVPRNIEGDENVISPLVASVSFGSPEICSLLAKEIAKLDHGSRQNLGDGLARAASKGRLDLMSAIAEHGHGSWAEASPSLALMAVRGGAPAIAAAEDLAPGLAKSSRNLSGYTPLMLAAARCAQATRALLPLSDPLAATGLGRTALTVALAHSNYEAAEALWSASDRRACLNESAKGLLAIACEGPSPDPGWLQRIIWEDPEQLNRQDSHGQSPLATAIWHQNEAAALALLSFGADATATDPNGNTALHMAAEHSASPTLIAALMSACDPNIQNDEGMTPLMKLLEQEDAEGFELLAQGSLMDLKNNKGQTAIDVAEAIEMEAGDDAHGCFTTLLRAICERQALGQQTPLAHPAARRKHSAL